MIEMNQVSYAYAPDLPALREITLRIRPGERVGLIGANGAGKSTLMKALVGLIRFEGSIRVSGLEVRRKTLPEIRRKIGFVLQHSDQQMFMPTVAEDMRFGLLNSGMGAEEAEARVDQVLAALQLTALKHRHNHRVSGGEKRMAAIATVLAMAPEVLVMDEPTAALDPFNRRQVIRTIQGLPQTLLIASHDLDMILDTCERVLLLSHGELVADGPAERILRDQALLEAHRLELPFRWQNG